MATAVPTTATPRARRAGGSGLLVLLLFAAACSASPRAPTAAEQSPSGAAPGSAIAPSATLQAAASPAREPLDVHVGFIPSLAYAPLYVAYEKGYYRERGLEVGLEPGAGSPTAQLGAGQLQFAGFGFDAAFFNARPGHRPAGDPAGVGDQARRAFDLPVGPAQGAVG